MNAIGLVLKLDATDILEFPSITSYDEVGSKYISYKEAEVSIFNRRGYRRFFRILLSVQNRTTYAGSSDEFSIVSSIVDFIRFFVERIGFVVLTKPV